MAPRARLNPPANAYWCPSERMPEDEGLGPPAAFFADSEGGGEEGCAVM